MLPLAGLWIVDGDLAHRRVQRGDFRRGMIGALLAEIRVGRRPDPGREPDPPLAIHHRVVNARVPVPDRLLAPIGRRLHRQFRGGRRLGIGNGMLDEVRLVVHRVEHRNHVRAFLGSAVDRAVGVEPRIVAVGGDAVVEIVFRRREVPHGDHHVALDALRPLRLGERHRARRDAVGPVGKILQCRFRSHVAQAERHVRHRLPGLRAARPARDTGSEFLRHRAHALAA